MPRAPGPAMPPVRAVMPSLRSASRPRDVRRSFFPEAARSASLRRELLLLMGGGGVRGAYPNALLSSTPPPPFPPAPRGRKAEPCACRGGGKQPPGATLPPPHADPHRGRARRGCRGGGQEAAGHPLAVCLPGDVLRGGRAPPPEAPSLLQQRAAPRGRVFFSFPLFLSFLFFSFFLFLSLQMKFSAALSYFSACDVNGT